jgi:integrase
MSHLWKRGQTYYAQLNVPKDVQKALGRAKLAQTLKTDSETEAKRRARPIIAHWKELIENARGNTDLSVRAQVWREALRKTGSEEEARLLKALITDEAYDLEAEGVPFQEVKQFHDAATGKRTPLKEYLEKHLTETGIKEKSKDERRRAFDELLAHHKTIEEIDRRKASTFLDDVLRPGKAKATVNKKISAYSMYWQWMIDKGILPEDHRNPWLRQMKKPKIGEEQPRRPFTEDEAREFFVEVLKSADRFPGDLVISKIMAATGMRLEEVCSMAKEDVTLKGDIAWIYVPEGKTMSSVRKVPVIDPWTVGEINARLSAEPEYIFEGLSANKYDSFGPAVSKRLGRRLRKVTDDPELVAGHSWRHTVSTQLEHGGVDRSTADWFVGHKRPGESLGRYSKGPSDEQLLEAARSITFPW